MMDQGVAQLHGLFIEDMEAKDAPDFIPCLLQENSTQAVMHSGRQSWCS